jgi:hypothetical protein
MGILLVWIQLILYTITLHYIYHYVPVVSHEILFLLVNSLWIPHIISYFISSFSFHSRYIPWDPHFLSLFNGHFSTLNWKHSTIYTAIFLRYIPCIALKNRLFSCGRYSSTSHKSVPDFFGELNELTFDRRSRPRSRVNWRSSLNWQDRCKTSWSNMS